MKIEYCGPRSTSFCEECSGRERRYFDCDDIRLLKPYKKHIKSITTDNGGEFAKHKLISKKLKIPVFFTDPYSSWQKGTVENTNKLIRQYIPKSMNIRHLSRNKLLVIQNMLNYRPRKVLFFNFPANIFYNFAS